MQYIIARILETARAKILIRGDYSPPASHIEMCQANEAGWNIRRGAGAPHQKARINEALACSRRGKAAFAKKAFESTCQLRYSKILVPSTIMTFVKSVQGQSPSTQYIIGSNARAAEVSSIQTIVSHAQQKTNLMADRRTGNESIPINPS